jgi:hypothetical protein
MRRFVSGVGKGIRKIGRIKTFAILIAPAWSRLLKGRPGSGLRFWDMMVFLL